MSAASPAAALPPARNPEIIAIRRAMPSEPGGAQCSAPPAVGSAPGMPGGSMGNRMSASSREPSVVAAIPRPASADRRAPARMACPEP